MMSEKRFTLEQWTEESLYFSDGEYSAYMSIEYICRKVEKKLNEQQATIRKLQDLCGESDGENAKLRIENKRLQKELNDCEKFRYTVFKILNEEYIKECSMK